MVAQGRAFKGNEMKTTQDMKAENDAAATKGEKIAPVKQASLAECTTQFQKTLKAKNGVSETPAKPAPKPPAGK